MFRVGIIGTGWVACDRHIPSFRAIPGVEVVGVFDRNQERAHEVADRMGIDFVASSREELFAIGLDAVSVATSPWSHAEHVGAALAAGLHVFCEKPMALDLQQARTMAEAAASAAKILTISHNFIRSRASQLAHAYLGPDPELTWVSAVQLSSEARRLPVWYRDLPAGLLFDEVPHLLYTLRDWCGPLRLAHASATWRADGHPGVVTALFEGAVPAQATLVFGAPLSEWHVTLVGPRRVVDLDLFRDIAVRLPSDHAHGAIDIARTSAKAMLDHGLGFVRSGVELARGRQRWGHDKTIAEFVGAARGQNANPVPVSDALAVVEMTDDLLDRIGAREHVSPRSASG
jgi:predicted dehydrogenase